MARTKMGYTNGGSLMCGIVGYITLDDDTLEHAKNKFFTEALFTNTLRGADSTGVMTLKNKFQWAWTKNAVPAPTFISEKDFRNRDTKTWCSIGHNRAATVGAVTTDNAHPFHHGQVMLVHNGTLRSTYDMLHRSNNITVDSELITYNLSKVKPEEAKDILGKLWGAYALIWFDARDKSVNVARNTERPLHLGINSDETILYFSSDGHLLNFIGQRLSNPLATPDKIWQMGTGQLLKYKKGSLVPEVTEIVPFVRTAVHNNQWQGVTSHEELRQRRLDRMSGRTSTSGCTVDRVMPGARAAEVGRCNIAGVVRAIPDSMLTMLKEWYMMDPQTEYLFEPKQFVPFGTRMSGVIYGRVWHPDWDSWLPAYVADGSRVSMTNFGTQWTAVPIGVDHSTLEEDAGHALTIMMRLKYFSYTGPAVEDPEEEPDIIAGGPEEEEDEDMLIGPFGEITEKEWVKLTDSGCVMCGGPIFIEDHEDIIWVGEMDNQPMCLGCLDEATTNWKGNENGYSKD
jgi:predicted glutamine amidotransferase